MLKTRQTPKATPPKGKLLFLQRLASEKPSAATLALQRRVRDTQADSRFKQFLRIDRGRAV